MLREFDVHMAILATRPEGLQTLVDRLCAAGVHGILNFVPKRVTVPGGCFVEETDITSQLELLSFQARSEAQEPGAAADEQSSPEPGEPAARG